ncbi:MAG: pentapeptide repeat-containing protein [bacterium]|nr:pentapeptide repeat-containing protein [bacterium]
MIDNNLFNSEYIHDSAFNDIIIPASTLRGKEFYKCSFGNCNLNEAKLEDCTFEDCNFNNCNMSVVKLTMSKFTDVRFYESKLLGVNWTEAKALSRLEFRKCKLNHSAFFGLSLRSIVIEECIANEVDFMDTNLCRSNCTMTDFQGSKFRNTDLSFADFTGARNYDINPNYNKIKKAVFSVPEVFTLLQCHDIVIR